MFKKNLRGNIDVFGQEYSRHSTQSDTECILKDMKQRGFPGMLRSLDYMRCEWKNFPIAWKKM